MLILKLLHPLNHGPTFYGQPVLLKLNYHSLEVLFSELHLLLEVGIVGKACSCGVGVLSSL
jgi:hypothetical protein